MARSKITIQKDNRAGRTRRWLVRWYGEYDPRTDKQKRYCESFERRKDAENLAQKLQREFDDGLCRDEKKITLRELTDRFLRVKRNSYTAGTLTNYRITVNRLLKYFDPNIQVAKIQREDAERFVSQIGYIQKNLIAKGKEMSDSGRSVELRNCKKIFNVAVEWNYIRTNPFAKLSLRINDVQSWHFINAEEFETILRCTRTTRHKAFYAIQYGCGLRSGEALNLLWDGINVDFESNRITIVNRPGSEDIPQFKIKDKEARSIPMPQWVVDILTKLHTQSSENCPFVFLTAERWARVRKNWHKFRAEGRAREWKNRNLQNNTLRDLQQCCLRAGIKTNEKLVLHSLRKSWATNLANSGVPVHTLMKMGGWSSIETVQEFYLKSTDENEKKAVEILNNLVGGCGRGVRLSPSSDTNAGKTVQGHHLPSP